MKYYRLKPPKGDGRYKKLWKVVDGAVADAFLMHPEYLTDKGKRQRTARNSVVKRVVGAVLSFSEQEKGRLETADK